MRRLSIIAIIAITLPMYQSQMVRQCTCAEWEPCRQLYHSNIWPCFDSCEPQLARLGANYNALRACLTSRHNQIIYAEDCIERSLGQMFVCWLLNRVQPICYSCTNVGGQFTQKRYIETLKLAAMNEIRHVFSNVHQHLTENIKTMEKFGTCVRKCLDRQAGNCFERMG